MPSVYEAAGGQQGLLRLAGAWHSRVMAAEGFGPVGGPATFSAAYGDESAVVRLHSGNGSHEEMDQRAIACFDQAMSDVELAGPVRAVLHDYFAWVTTASLTRYSESADDVPEGLRLPQWYWDGLQTEA